MATFCSRCHTANRSGSRFCNNCGAPLDAPVEKTCPACQAAVPAHSAYCPCCGTRLAESLPTPVTPPEPITEMDETSDATASEESEIISLDQVPVTETTPVSPTPTDQEAPVEPEIAAADQSAPPPSQPLLRLRTRPRPSAIAPVGARSHQPEARPNPWRRVSYAVLALAVLIGVVLPTGALGTVDQTAPEVTSLFNTVQSLPAGSPVLVSFDYEPLLGDEMGPLAEAVLTHLMRRRARLFVMSTLPQGPALAKAVLGSLADVHGYRYGNDYVNFGFLPGGSAALAALSTDIITAFGKDYDHAQPLTAFAVVAPITGVASMSLVIELAGDESTLVRWVEQVQSRHRVRLAAATTAVAMPLAFPYVQSGQLAGLASGLPAAAEYEAALGYDGSATRGMNAQTLGHMAILLFVVVANLALLLPQRRR